VAGRGAERVGGLDEFLVDLAARTGSLTPGKDADVILRALGTGLLESRDRVAAAVGVPLDGTWRPQPKTA
ncbi:hypothetical protein ACWEQ3_31195, partial [Streptomyces mirabilis]